MAEALKESTLEDTENVEIVNLPSKGRAMIAKRHIKKGELILSEIPLVSAQHDWNRFYKYRACHHCMRPLESAQEMARRLTGIPQLELPHYQTCAPSNVQSIVHCPKCGVEYCCKECYDKSQESYHLTLCHRRDDLQHPLYRLEEAWRCMFYPPETATVFLLARMMAMVVQCSDPEGMIQKFNSFHQRLHNAELNAALRLLQPNFTAQLNQLRMILKEYFTSHDLDNWLNEDGFKRLFALIGTNGQGIGTSNLAQYVTNLEKLSLSDNEREKMDVFIEQLYIDLEKESGEFLNCEGSGLYQLQSSCNHSCEPNAEIHFRDNSFILSLVALTDIGAGDEVCTSYLDECVRQRSRHSRQKILQEYYLFKCQCPKCRAQAGDPDLTSEDSEDGSLDELC